MQGTVGERAVSVNILAEYGGICSLFHVGLVDIDSTCLYVERKELGLLRQYDSSRQKHLVSG